MHKCRDDIAARLRDENVDAKLVWLHKRWALSEPSPLPPSSTPPPLVADSLLNECHIQLLYNERLSQWVSDSDAVEVVAVVAAAAFVAVASENQFRA